MFINNCPSMGLSINSYAKANGYYNSDVSGLVEDIIAERAGSCPLEGAKSALEDGSVWAGTDVAAELLEQLHALICEHEEIAPVSTCTHDVIQMAIDEIRGAHGG